MARKSKTKTTLTEQFVQFLIARRTSITWLLLITIALLAGALYWYEQTPERVAARRSARLSNSPAEELQEQLDVLVRGGDAGVRATVDALTHERPEVIEAARRSLREEVERWRLLDPYEGTRRLGNLAELIKDRIHRFRPSEQDFAAEIASEILLWPLRGETYDRLAIIDDCEQILRDSYQRQPAGESYADLDAQYDAILARLNGDRIRRLENEMPEEIADSQTAGAEPKSMIELANRSANPALTDDSTDTKQIEVSGEPSSVVPTTSADISTDTSTDSNSDDASLVGDSSRAGRDEPNRFEPPTRASEQSVPRTLPGTSESSPNNDESHLAFAQESGDITGSFPSASLILPGDSPLPLEPLTASEIIPIGDAGLTQTVHNNPPRTNQVPLTTHGNNSSQTGRLELEATRADKSEYRWWPHIDLMRHLHDSDEEFAKLCREELRTRKFSVSQINFSFRITHPDPTIRLAAVEELSTVRFDPGPWLRFLADDVDAATRTAAIKALSGSSSADDLRLVNEKLQEPRNAALLEEIKRR